MPDNPSSRGSQPAERSGSDGAAPGRSSRGTWREPPLWVRWALTLIVFAGLAGAALIGLRSGAAGYHAPDASAVKEANRETQILVAEDQAPHSVTLRRDAIRGVALERAIAADVTARIRRHELGGPLQRSVCRPSGPPRESRQAFRCTVLAGDVRYPFVAVVEARARRLTWCKRDPPPTPALDIPVSRRCRR